MNEKANTPLEQIYKNTKDIKELKEDIAPVYKSNVNLGALADAVDVADTNLTEDVTKAFIVDFNGNLYKFIAFNEDKTKAYIEYYANVKGEKGDTGETGAQGPQGEQGPAGRDGADDINDSTIANNKLWSSQKTNTEIGKAKDKGVYYTTTQPTSDTTLAINDIENINNDIAIKANDLIIYIDSNSNPASIYFVISVGETDLDVSKIADFASGGGGGGIPTIEITSAQIIDDYNFTFTQQQGQVLFEYPPIINLVLDGFSLPLIYAYDETNKFVYSSVVFSNFDNVKSLYCQLITFNTSTLRGSIVDETFEKPKQLYQHNIYIEEGVSKLTCKIINDNNTSFTFNTLLNYLNTNGFTSATKILETNGRLSIGSEYINTAIGMFYEDSTHIRVIGFSNSANSYVGSSFIGATIVDTIIEL